MNDEATYLDQIAARLEAEPDGPDLCPVSECEVCIQVRDARALLAAVRQVAAIHHRDSDGDCWADGDPWPCPTARAVALTEETNDV